MDTGVCISIEMSFIGPHVALFARDCLPEILRSLSSFKSKDYKTALAKALLEIERILRSEAGKKALAKIHSELTSKVTSLLDDETEELGDVIGCTACVALVADNKIFVAKPVLPDNVVQLEDEIKQFGCIGEQFAQRLPCPPMDAEGVKAFLKKFVPEYQPTKQ